ncbi:hypothetical protein [Massilia eburnea]|uniref:hypothetical protein n=1 Tax=Massilia eburnea TaxID=1776165 RepID=UPI003D6ABC23
MATSCGRTTATTRATAASKARALATTTGSPLGQRLQQLIALARRVETAASARRQQDAGERAALNGACACNFGRRMGGGEDGHAGCLP